MEEALVIVLQSAGQSFGCRRLNYHRDHGGHRGEPDALSRSVVSVASVVKRTCERCSRVRATCSCFLGPLRRRAHDLAQPVNRVARAGLLVGVVPVLPVVARRVLDRAADLVDRAAEVVVREVAVRQHEGDLGVAVDAD